MNLRDLLFRDPSLKKVREEYEVSSLLQSKWADIWGNLAEDIDYDFVKNKQLFVKVSNPLWVKEIDFFKSMILEKMNRLLPRQSKILGIRISLLPKNEQKEIKEDIIEENTLSLEERIVSLNREKIKKGYHLCSKCQTVLTQEKICPFCRCHEIKWTFE